MTVRHTCWRPGSLRRLVCFAAASAVVVAGCSSTKDSAALSTAAPAAASPSAVPAPVSFGDPTELTAWFTGTGNFTCTGDVTTMATCTPAGSRQTWHLKWAPGADGDRALLASECQTGAVDTDARVITNGRSWTLRPTRPEHDAQPLLADLQAHGLTDAAVVAYCGPRRPPPNFRPLP